MHFLWFGSLDIEGWFFSLNSRFWRKECQICVSGLLIADQNFKSTISRLSSSLCLCAFIHVIAEAQPKITKSKNIWVVLVLEVGVPRDPYPGQTDKVEIFLAVVAGRGAGGGGDPDAVRPMDRYTLGPNHSSTSDRLTTKSNFI